MKYILIFCLILSCSHKVKHDQENLNSHGDNVANIHMHQHSHELLISKFEDPKRDLWQNPGLVLKLIGPLKDKTLFDLGVGSGYFSHHFLNEKALVIGADVDQKFLDHVSLRFKENQNFKTHLMDLNNPNISENSFDIIFSSNAYHHIENRIQYFRKVLPGLKTNGKLVILDFKKDVLEPVKLGPPQAMRIDQSVVTLELRQAGFEIMNVFNQKLSEQYLIIATKTDNSKFIQEATTLTNNLKESLIKNLSEKIQNTGPLKAITFCKLKVKDIAKKTAGNSVKKFEFGRTSHKIRNIQNNPQEWVKTYLDEFKEIVKKDNTVQSIVHRNSNKKRVLLTPLFVESKCLLCHGEGIHSEILNQIKKNYPKDQATGFKLGQFRGFIWVKEK